MTKPFDLLAQFGKFGAERCLSLNDPASRSAFVSHVHDSVERAMADPTLIHGQRTEAMFEALLISLGEYRLLKAEDGGRVFPADEFGVPDFRVVLKDGAHWLIEVKNVYEADAFNQLRNLMTRDYRKKLEAYATLTGAELKLAVFWARWAIWTLVSPSRLVEEDGGLTLDMMTAMKVNELGRLGDRSIGTRSPLRLHLTTDPEKTSSIGPDGMVSVTIGNAQLFCGDKEIRDPTEQAIAWTFISHGEWQEQEAEPVIEENRLRAIHFCWEPEESTNAGFEIIGTLSRMFARYYAEHTTQNREIVQLRAPMRPNWFGPLIHVEHKSEALPLWRFTLKPNYS